MARPSNTHALKERLRAARARTAARLWKSTLSQPVGRLFQYDIVVNTGNFGKTQWAGVPIWQNVLDLWTIQETIFEVKPALLIETGTHRGGSALFYGQLMDVADEGAVITIDIVQRHELDHPRVSPIHGSSIDPEVVEQVRQAAAEADGPVMVILDGNHDRDHVARELELYAPLVTSGSYLLSQDGIIDQMRIFRDSRPGPLEANRQFLASHPEFEHDEARTNRFNLTHHPLGWLRRL